MAMAENKAPMVALLASPGMGHLIPVGEFAKLLAHDHGFSVTIFSASFGPLSPPHQAYIDSLPTTITSVLLSPVQLHKLPEDIRGETCIFLTMAASIPSLRQAFQTLTASSRVVALVVLFSTDAFEVAREFGIRPYLFFPPNALCLSFLLRLPQLDRSTEGEYRELKEPIQLPGCIPIHGRDLVDTVQDRKNAAYPMLLQRCRRFLDADGIFVNSFLAMEMGAIMALEKDARCPRLYPIGPLIRTGLDNAEDGPDCLKWLDEQPPCSVVFVSFGSGGTLLPEQMTELDMGLELSEQQFLWVARSPDERDTFDSLQEGFLRRTEGRVGMVESS